MPWVNVEDRRIQLQPSRGEIREVLDYIERQAKPRFYADENFPARATALLRKMGAKVLTAQDVGCIRHPDENQTAYALQHGLILVSCDRDFLDERRFPLIHCPAIFVFDFGFGTAHEIWQAFGCLASVFLAPQFFDKWWKINAHPESWTEYCRFQNGTTTRVRYRVWRDEMQEWVEKP